jgi:ABC-type branched-subunit amino acid transport system ATPase component
MSSDTNNILETQGLTKRFGKLTAVDDVDLTVERGATVGLIGPNGAGKTTFQSVIMGQYAASEGSIIFNGEDITGLEPYQRARKGIIKKFQVTRVYNSETLVENIRLAIRGRNTSTLGLLRSHSDEDVDERIHELLEVANLDSKAYTKAENLAHGEQQWLEIIMAVSTNPELLLLDEPTSGMGAQETNETIELLNDLKERTGASMLIVEHDMDFIQEVSNNLTVLHHGAVLAQGSVEEVQNNETVREVYLGRD